MAQDEDKPTSAPPLPGEENAGIDRLIDVLGKQPALSGKPTRRPIRASTNPLKKYNKQRGMLKKE